MPNDKPATATWYATPDGKARLLVEKDAMARFPDFQLFLMNDERYPWHGLLGWYGPLTTPRGTQYVVHVMYPPAFPNEPPRVYPFEPLIQLVAADGQRLVHQYQDGHMCLFHPNDRTFTTRTTAATVTAVAAAWLFCYEHWVASGGREWPGKAAGMVELHRANRG